MDGFAEETDSTVAPSTPLHVTEATRQRSIHVQFLMLPQRLEPRSANVEHNHDFRPHDDSGQPPEPLPSFHGALSPIPEEESQSLELSGQDLDDALFSHDELRGHPHLLEANQLLVRYGRVEDFVDP